MELLPLCKQQHTKVSLAYGGENRTEWNTSRARGTVKHYLHGGPISYVERTVNLALGFSALSEQSGLVGPCLKPTTKESRVGREAAFPEFLCSGSNPRCGLQSTGQGAGLWRPEAASQEFWALI